MRKLVCAVLSSAQNFGTQVSDASSRLFPEAFNPNPGSPPGVTAMVTATADATLRSDGLRKPKQRTTPQHWAFHGAYAPVDEECILGWGLIGMKSP